MELSLPARSLFSPRCLWRYPFSPCHLIVYLFSQMFSLFIPHFLLFLLRFSPKLPISISFPLSHILTSKLYFLLSTSHTHRARRVVCVWWTITSVSQSRASSQTPANSSHDAGLKVCMRVCVCLRVCVYVCVCSFLSTAMDYRNFYGVPIPVRVLAERVANFCQVLSPSLSLSLSLFSLPLIFTLCLYLRFQFFMRSLFLYLSPSHLRFILSIRLCGLLERRF